MPAEPAPIACTLTPAAYVDRQGAWRQVIATTYLGREPTSRGVRLLLQPDAETAVRRLAALEAECCAWFATRVEPGTPLLVDFVAETNEGAAVLQEMFATADG